MNNFLPGLSQFPCEPQGSV